MALDFDLLIKIVGALILPGLVILIFLKKKFKRNNQVSYSEPHPVGEGEIYDKEALKKAEEEVAKIDLRAEFLKNGLVKIDQLYSMHGYNESAMLRLTKQFMDQGIMAEYLFIHSAPGGAAGHGHTGVYELFVDSEQEEKARELLRQILNS